MAVIIKSNSKYSGSQSLISVADATQTAQEFYDQYAAWVQADGGIIVDPIATMDAIVWAKNLGILGKVQAVSASWGIKTQGGYVTKVYGFNGDTFSWTGAAGTLINSGVFPVVLYPASGSTLRQETRKRNIRSNKYLMSLIAKKQGSLFFSASIGYGVIGSGGYDSIVFKYPAAGSSNIGSIHGVQGKAASVTAISPSIDFSADASLFNVDDSISLAFRAGVQGNSFQNTSGNPYLDTSSTDSNEISIGQYLSNGTYTGASENCELAEFWLINDATPEIALSLTARLSDIYG